MFGCKKLNGIIAYQTVEVYRQTDRQTKSDQWKKSAVKVNAVVYIWNLKYGKKVLYLGHCL